MTEGQRRCIGSTKFGIEAHDAPVDDFPAQPSQKDGLGRMCKEHWTQYTRALRQASVAAKAGQADRVAAKRGPRVVAKGKAAPKGKTAAVRGAKAALQAVADAEYNERTRTEAQASTPDFEAAAAEDEILAERRERVKAWRKSELESPKPMSAPGVGADAVEA